MRLFVIILQLIILLRETFSNVELDVNTNPFITQDYSLKFPTANTHDVHSVRIVKDGNIIIEKTVFEIGKGLEMDIDGKYLHPGENILEVFFISSSGDIIERNILSVNSPPLSANDEPLHTKGHLLSSVWDDISQTFSNLPDRPPAIAAVGAGAVSMGAAVLSYRNKVPSTGATNAASNIKSIDSARRTNDYTKALSHQHDKSPMSYPTSINNNQRPYIAPQTQSNLLVDSQPKGLLPSGLRRYTSQTRQKIRLSVTNQLEKIPLELREPAAVVLGGGAVVAVAHLGRMLVSSVVDRVMSGSRSSSNKIKKQQPQQSRRRAIRRPWGRVK